MFSNLLLTDRNSIVMAPGIFGIDFSYYATKGSYLEIKDGI